MDLEICSKGYGKGYQLRKFSVRNGVALTRTCRQVKLGSWEREARVKLNSFPRVLPEFKGTVSRKLIPMLLDIVGKLSLYGLSSDH